MLVSVVCWCVNSQSTVFNRQHNTTACQQCFQQSQLGESTPYKNLSTVFNRQHSFGFCIATLSYITLAVNDRRVNHRGLIQSVICMARALIESDRSGSVQQVR